MARTKYTKEFRGVSIEIETDTFLDSQQRIFLTVKYGEKSEIGMQVDFSGFSNCDGGFQISPLRASILQIVAKETPSEFGTFWRVSPGLKQWLFDLFPEIAETEKDKLTALIAESRACIAKANQPKEEFLPFLQAVIPYWRRKIGKGHKGGLTGGMVRGGVAAYDSYSTSDELNRYEADFKTLTGRDFVESDALSLEQALSLPYQIEG